MKTITKIATIAAIIAASFASAKAAPINGNAEYIKSEGEGKSMVETNLFYEVAGVKGFTFVDFNEQGNTYFGKTTFTPKSGNGVRAQIIHGTAMPNQYGIGITMKLPKVAGVSGSVYNVPLWVDREGEQLEKNIVGVSLGAKLPYDIGLFAFNEWNLRGANGIASTYGEIGVTKNVGQFTLMYNPSLNGNGDATPELEQRVSIGFNFK
ncbi:hypothetical protein C4573_06135 [Candidatus Woesearchaeota archaeon]|nr:MAG: hypothetical protein C4573_06135 [Candidatus Woesearchaeota archaeon]